MGRNGDGHNTSTRTKKIQGISTSNSNGEDNDTCSRKRGIGTGKGSKGGKNDRSKRGRERAGDREIGRDDMGISGFESTSDGN